MEARACETSGSQKSRPVWPELAGLWRQAEAGSAEACVSRRGQESAKVMRDAVGVAWDPCWCWNRRPQPRWVLGCPEAAASHGLAVWELHSEPPDRPSLTPVAGCTPPGGDRALRLRVCRVGELPGARGPQHGHWLVLCQKAESCSSLGLLGLLTVQRQSLPPCPGHHRTPKRQRGRLCPDAWPSWADASVPLLWPLPGGSPAAPGLG